jgi:CheY-like chemotaxis protein/anti-sigma regulatory factor (Ser/Thr protein kinase)
MGDRQIQTLRTIIESGQHLLALINDILDLSKIEAGKVEMQIEWVEIGALCEAAIRMVKEQAHQKEIQLVFTLETLAAALPADPRRLKQILVNLLSNAVKFTPEQGQIGLQVRDEPDGQQLRFTVWDTGIGIAPEQLARLFKPFVQVDSSLTRQYGGTGLGLALVQRLVTAHKGRVEVESQPGQGSRFAIILPLNNQLANGDSLPVNQPNKLTQAAAAFIPESHLILLVDDNALSREGLADYVEFLGYATLVAINGSDALAKAQQSQPDLFIVDVQMPGMDGLELIRRLRAMPHFAQTPIIALTAHNMPGDRERCLQAGASHYLAKPIELALLSELLPTVLLAQDVSTR